MNTSQVALSSSPQLLSASTKYGRSILVTLHGAFDVFLGNSSAVSTGVGFRIKGIDGAAAEFYSKRDVWAICQTGESVNVSVMAYPSDITGRD